MAVPITPGVGTDIGTDLVGTTEYQVMKIGLGAATALDNIVDAGPQLAAESIPVVLASDHADVKVTLDSEAVVLGAGTAGIGKLTANAGVTIGAVEIATAQTLATLTTLTGGGVAHDAADAGNPHKIGYRAVTVLAAASAANDRVDGQADLMGRGFVTDIPPEMFKSVAVNYTTTQTGAVIIDPTAGKRLAIKSIVVGTYATTGARLILWFGANADTTYTAGTDQAIVIASFAPSTTSKPGIVYTPATPDYCLTADHELHVTTDGNLSVDICVKYFEW